MSADRIHRPTVASWAIALSFVPLLVKAIDYALLGSFVPLLALGLFAGLVTLGLRGSSRAASRAVAIWALALVLWGLIRLGLMGLFTWTSVHEAHVQGQFTIGYVLISLGNAALGTYLFRSRRQIPASVES